MDKASFAVTALIVIWTLLNAFDISPFGIYNASKLCLR